MDAFAPPLPPPKDVVLGLFCPTNEFEGPPLIMLCLSSLLEGAAVTVLEVMVPLFLIGEPFVGEPFAFDLTLFLSLSEIDTLFLGDS